MMRGVCTSVMQKMMMTTGGTTNDVENYLQNGLVPEEETRIP